MTYYILLPNDNDESSLFSSNILGEESFGYFYPDQGMQALYQMVNKNPEILINVKILDEKRKEYSLTEFFDILDSLEIRKM